MLQDKEQDNGINIKFGPDKGKKGEYRLVSQNSINGKKKMNGTTKQGARVPRQPQLCASCAAIQHHHHGAPRQHHHQRTYGRCMRYARGVLRTLAYLLASLVLSLLGWFLYEEFFDCFWNAAQSLVYTSVALLASSAALLTFCKSGEFSVSPTEIYS